VYSRLVTQFSASILLTVITKPHEAAQLMRPLERPRMTPLLSIVKADSREASSTKFYLSEMYIISLKAVVDIYQVLYEVVDS
jgi:uncharacterized lipoprotein YajG